RDIATASVGAGRRGGGEYGESLCRHRHDSECWTGTEGSRRSRKVMVGKTFNDAKGNTELRKCLDCRSRLFHIELHFFFFSESTRKKAQIGEPLFIRIFYPSGALKLIVG